MTLWATSPPRKASTGPSVITCVTGADASSGRRCLRERKGNTAMTPARAWRASHTPRQATLTRPTPTGCPAGWCGHRGGKARWSSRTTPWDFRSGRRPTATPYSAPTTIPAGYSRSTARRGPRCATPATATGSLRGSLPPAAPTVTARTRGNRHTATTRWASRWSASFREASSARSPMMT